MNQEFLHEIDLFVNNTSGDVFLDQENSPPVIKAERIRHFDRAGFEMLHSLYKDKAGAKKTVEIIHKKYGKKKDIIEKDLAEIFKSLNTLISDGSGDKIKISVIQDSPDKLNCPIRTEMTLTYRCQNKCYFCHSPAPINGNTTSEMTTNQVKLVIDKIYNEAGVMDISFTGGEPLMRKDLPELVEYASKKGIKTGIFTNGIKCSDRETVSKLSGSGLQSARVNLESHDEFIHNRITGNIESYTKTVSGIHNLIEAGISTRTGTTICRGNRDHLLPLVKFLKNEFDLTNISMNMIPAAWLSKDFAHFDINYSCIPSILEPVLKFCGEAGIKLEWLSATPHCIFNPGVPHIETGTCGCFSGYFSINPEGDVTPCSGYSRAAGNLLADSFSRVWESEEAVYFREKKFLPPVCKKCSMKTGCEGACPLYWENAGSFREIETANNRRPFVRNIIWSLYKRLRSAKKNFCNIRAGSLQSPFL